MGGTSSLGALISANGGNPGLGSPAGPFACTDGGTGGVTSGGDIGMTGSGGGASFAVFNASFSAGYGGFGGASPLGGSAASQGTVDPDISSTDGNPGVSYGGGGAGGYSLSAVGASPAAAGGGGSPGLVVITEFI